MALPDVEWQKRTDGLRPFKSGRGYAPEREVLALRLFLLECGSSDF